ncbi:MAG: glycosyl hydrolase family 28-related protein [Verrucomicrobiota bacterium]
MKKYTKIAKLCSQCMIATAALFTGQNLMGEASDLYGPDGELWTDISRIPDFSYAGYRQGEYDIPSIPVVADVKADFGAVGDGVTDDTQAFLNAISATNNGAIFIPAGTYVINDFLRISKPNLVLRGAGVGTTVLHFPTSCQELEPRDDPFYTGYWYHGRGGFIWVEGDYQHVDLANITADTPRGDYFLTVDSTAGLQVGQTVEIKQIDDAADTLAVHLYCGDAGDVNEKEIQPWQMVRIKSISGTTVEIDRPLHFDVKLGWDPKIRSFDPTVSEVGIEDLTITTGRVEYAGHFYEEWNGIYFMNIADSWVRNVDVINADEAYLIKGRFCTLDSVSYSENTGTADPLLHLGHNGIFFDFPGSDNLCINFNVGTKYRHSISVRETAGNVFSNGTGNQIDFDMASHVNYSNLFTEIFTKRSNKVWEGSGRNGTGNDAGAWSTFWNIKSNKNVTSYPPERWADKINIVGITTTLPSVKDLNGFWFEAIDPDLLEPQNLYQHQLGKRLTSLPQGIPVPGIIEVEDFDQGVNLVGSTQGDIVTYNDTTPGNSGNAYRLDEDVDIRPLSTGSGYAVGWTVAGEWLEFTVEVAETGIYSGSVEVASGQSSNKSFSIWGPDPNNPGSLIDLTGPVAFSTGGAGWDVWQSVGTPPISLDAGVQTLRYVMNTSSFDTDFIQLSLTSSVTEILFDDFETGFGNWIDGGKDCLYEVSGNFVNGTAGVINLQDNTNSSTLTTPDLALSAYSEVIVEFDYQVTNFNNVEDFWLQISTDAGATYETVKTYTRNVEFTNGTVYNDETVVITPTSGLTDQTRIRFRCDASNNSDDLYLDDIRISAQ